MTDLFSRLPLGEKFLLGFSGGVDSSALFFMLLEKNICFDLAIVDYGVREESKLEVLYAQELAQRFNKRIFVLHAPKIEKNFEANARLIRYGFFKDIIQQEKYRGLILAHQLDDRLEWFLMQLSKGAGLNTLLGFDFLEQVYGFDVFRPLLEVSKKELYAFCEKHNITFFEDASNQSEEIRRNRFRKLASFLSADSRGVCASFSYLSKEKTKLYPKTSVEVLANVRGFQRVGELADLHQIDLECKKLGYVLSSKQRQEIVRCHFSCEIGGIIIECNEEMIFVAPKITCAMDRAYRDWARRLKIPQRLRPLFYHLWGTKWGDQRIESFLFLRSSTKR